MMGRARTGALLFFGLALSGCTSQLNGATSGLLTDLNTLEMVCPTVIQQQDAALKGLKANLAKP
jgi:hypothetical protein